MSSGATRRIILGITGGIAAYKAADLTRQLLDCDLGVQVVMTEAACRFITPVTFQALSGRPVFTDLWSPAVDNGMAHIELSRGADLLLVAPASADFLAKLAQGVADDLLSTLCLARDCPLLVAPAMNRQMWENPATQRNVTLLRQDGVGILGPDSGSQACGENGMGRMMEPAALSDAVAGWFEPKVLVGRHVVITAGPTFERIDAVRGITNLSSGRMGYAVARAARNAGAKVTLIAGPTALPDPGQVVVHHVTSAEQMLTAVEGMLPGCDIFIAVAAVADYTPLAPQAAKIKKDARILAIELAPTADILANVASRANPPFCVGFAAESEKLDEYAEAKRRRKHLPLLAANLAHEAIGAQRSRLVLFDDAGRHDLGIADKDNHARTLIHHLARLYNAAGATPAGSQ
ncbi:MAG: bifunctional phosphopantothenoylcysteine decarboxylase/phosphopantothenate--cysteine ligase CoaBC [Betaproteobacteria bacterium]|jgi:phosphopantothenoylcysteine decarboxylase/phosphopantothenate--cysteine ligase|nr:bifunctional phosphopantothenoylcysteine decarboxylase/phosphopantothenate--cysteine ligase CoaBC [Rhodocyclaceae bacterium]MCA3134484.1 bifunctional phosphopantothenoylcysteine decarboxylase/phosphopantothenate--cysteine ligase CoaBC [Rhodocyclaceae bacterium]MCA3143950.1 bifunctional phosphopantothenoylcysteine decarboxylase/phosphopantothenate--cysteine ligase CoaBC [Rhodocyclaceae bacterium]MCA3145675.1 bifunctional phosphopantothenoylcysteine decarboxylase/phosphopantothenate--cysteine l